MEAKAKEDIINELRQTLLDHISMNEKSIATNERVVVKFNRIMNWQFIIFLMLSLATITGIVILIYMVNQPVSATGVAMKQVQDLTKTVSLQQKLNETERQDISKAREQISPVLRILDSINRKQDSIINAQYKKDIK